jgi:SM-20-related protein
MADPFPRLTDDEVRAMGEGRVVVRSVDVSVEVEAARPHLRIAGVGKDRAAGVRDDRIAWLEDVPPLSELDAWFRSGAAILSEALRMRLDRVETQIALYSQGGYAAHRDTFADDPARRITAILYLNSGWEPSWGGELRAYEPDGVRDIAPKAGTFVLFSSPHLRHEVLEVRHERWAATAWYGIGSHR